MHYRRYFDTFKYPIEKAFPAITVDYLNYHNAYAEFFALHNADKLSNSMIDSVYIAGTDEGGMKSYYVSIDAAMYDVGNILLEGDAFSTILNITEDTNGNIAEVVIRTYGDEMLPNYENMTEQEIIDAMKPIVSQKISYLLPSIELSDDAWKLGEMQIEEETYTIEGFDVALECMWSVSLNPAGFLTWEVQLAYDAV